MLLKELHGQPIGYHRSPSLSVLAMIASGGFRGHIGKGDKDVCFAPSLAEADNSGGYGKYIIRAYLPADSSHRIEYPGEIRVPAAFRHEIEPIAWTFESHEDQHLDGDDAFTWFDWRFPIDDTTRKRLEDLVLQSDWPMDIRLYMSDNLEDNWPAGVEAIKRLPNNESALQGLGSQKAIDWWAERSSIYGVDDID